MKKTTDKINTAELAQACVDSVNAAAAEIPVSVEKEVDAASVDGGENTQSAVIDIAAIDFKKLKLRTLPKGLTIDTAAEIINVVNAIKSGKPNNTIAPYTAFNGFTLEEYKIFYAESLMQTVGVSCLVTAYNGRSRAIELLVAVNNKYYKIVTTTNTQYPVAELVAKGFKGADCYGYADSTLRNLRSANDAGEILIGAIAYNHIVEKNFCCDTICFRQKEKSWWAKTYPAIYNFCYNDKGNNRDDLSTIIDNATLIDYRDVKNLNDYLAYLRGVIKDSDKEYTQSQKDAVKALLGKIGA